MVAIKPSGTGTVGPAAWASILCLLNCTRLSEDLWDVNKALSVLHAHPCSCTPNLCAVQPNLAWAPTKPDASAPPTKGQLVNVPAVSRVPILKQIVMPVKGQNVFVAPNANVMGDVKIGANSSIWYGAVLRGARPGPKGKGMGGSMRVPYTQCTHVGKRPGPLRPVLQSKETWRACRQQQGSGLGKRRRQWWRCWREHGVQTPAWAASRT